MIGFRFGSGWRRGAWAVLFCAPLSAHAEDHWLTQPALNPLEAGSVYAKFGVSRFDPNSSSGPLTFDRDTNVLILGTVLPAGPVAGSRIGVSPDEIATITLGYMLTPHIAIETALGLPTLKFDNTGQGSLPEKPPVRVRIPRLSNVQVGPLDGKIADVTAAPLNLKFIYQPFPNHRVRPYVGASATYTTRMATDLLGACRAEGLAIHPYHGLAILPRHSDISIHGASFRAMPHASAS